MTEDAAGERARVLTAIRGESESAKACFTTISFQSLTLSAAVIGLIFAASDQLPLTAIGGLPLAILLTCVCRIGLHKYSTANRNAGYQLHLERTAHLPDMLEAAACGAWRRSMREIGWEEALRAWRIVQPRLFRSLYRTPEEFPFPIEPLRGLRRSMYHLKADAAALARDWPDASTPERFYPWFLLKVLARRTFAPQGNQSWFVRAWLKRRSQGRHEMAYYHAGSYLGRMFKILILMEYLAIFPLIVVPFRLWSREWALASFCWTLAALALGAIHLSAQRLQRRRLILEDELLSIHSCAIVWQAVVLAHFRALGRLDRSFEHYTERLLAEADDLADHRFEIHAWVRGDLFDGPYDGEMGWALRPQPPS